MSCRSGASVPSDQGAFEDSVLSRRIALVPIITNNFYVVPKDDDGYDDRSVR